MRQRFEHKVLSYESAEQAVGKLEAERTKGMEFVAVLKRHSGEGYVLIMRKAVEDGAGTGMEGANE
jgi:hypothetical protein